MFRRIKKKRSNFFSDYVDLLYYKCEKIDLKRGASHIDSSDWIKTKRLQ